MVEYVNKDFFLSENRSRACPIIGTGTSVSIPYCETAGTDEGFLFVAEEPFYAPSWPEKNPPCATYSRVFSISSHLKHEPSESIHVCHPDINSSTDRKPFDIKLLVFRGKSHRNFLFYTRSRKKLLPHPVKLHSTACIVKKPLTEDTSGDNIQQLYFFKKLFRCKGLANVRFIWEERAGRLLTVSRFVRGQSDYFFC